MSYQTLPPGIRFGAYEIVAVLGSGAFGTVYEALRHPLRKRVALKLLNPDMLETPEAVSRFLREAEIGAQLHHPHIVDVQELGSFNAIPFLTMEYLAGETLEDRVEREGRLSVATAVDLLLPVISAVAAMHDQGLVHRDLKPSNVFITQGPQGDHPKLIDFGIVKVSQTDVSLTRTASLLGTPSFMAPEQVREAKDIDARADVWSLGVILYHAVTGVIPFTGGSMFETFDQVMHAPIVPPSEHARGLPPGFDAVVLRAMRRESSARTATARGLGAALLPFASPASQTAWSKDFQRISLDHAPPFRLSLTSPAMVVRPPEPTVMERTPLPTKPPRASRPTRTALVASAVGALLLAIVGATVLRAFPQPSDRAAAVSAVIRVVRRRPPPDVVTPTAPVVDVAPGEAGAPSAPTHRRRAPRREAPTGPSIGNY